MRNGPTLCLLSWHSERHHSAQGAAQVGSSPMKESLLGAAARHEGDSRSSPTSADVDVSVEADAVLRTVGVPLRGSLTSVGGGGAELPTTSLHSQMAMDKESLLAGVAPQRMDCSGPPVAGMGVAYVDNQEPDRFCHWCTTDDGLWGSILCFPIWPLAWLDACCCIPVNEREEQVLLVFGEYYSTLRSPGMHYVNPMGLEKRVVSTKRQNMDIGSATQSFKVADRDGNPVIVSGVISFRIIDSKAAALDVENAQDFVQTQAQTVLKQIVSRYPYESTDGAASLKTETYEIGLELCRTLQEKVHVAGVLVESFELSDLSYAPEIAQVMLVRQQAKAMVDARQTIVDGAVGIVNTAITRLAREGTELTTEDRSKLTINLLTVICGESGATPTVALN
eukprot:COSAG02_NODE_363_length_23785_cov_21.830828_4_plen_394_part_00